ncbi:DNA-formamidopyrimidine glycosylase family protein [Ornithinimicrobium panacihumi]|uniref:DNA-formamidopyrimidine glycosylase family protein n=1 Tax=Ornithinimicrobium panacihumi TaxID=2008449 RepID=UPI003F8C2DB4
MPEGDAVWLTAQRLHRGLAGAVLTGSDLRVPALATSDLTGRRTLEVVPRGKHLLHRLGGGLTLHSHLRMDGSWRVRPLGARYAAARRHTTRALLWTAERVAVGDSLGMLDLVRTEDEGSVVGHLGPDLLDPAFDRAAAVANLLRAPDLAVAEALLDQRNLAGIGTIYASEPLFLHGVNPWTPVGAVGAEALGEILDTTRTLMVRTCREGRLATTGRAGVADDTWVFARKGLPCHRCGGAVRMATVGQAPRQRVLNYCPACQGGLAAHDDGGAQAPLGHRPPRYLDP